MEIGREKEMQNITLWGSFVNLLLIICKLLGGIFGHSSALIADAAHSISDFVSDIVVLFSIRIAAKPQDDDHEYGHGKYETLATLAIGFLLVVVAIGIIFSGIEKIINIYKGKFFVSPTMLALIMAFLSIISKEIMYWITLRKGQKVNSQLLIANAWHHRSDALSSIATAAGIIAIFILGEKWIILDPLMAILVSFFILKTAWNFIRPSLDELTEKALPQETEKKIKEIVSSVEGISFPHNLKTRKIGNIYAIDLHVIIDGNKTVKEAHHLTKILEENLRQHFGQQTQISIHIEEENHE